MAEVVYIAGKMTGLSDLGKEKFDRVAEELKAKGYIVLNPANLPVGMRRETYMPICFDMVNAADVVYALDNWQDSDGARLEVHYALYQKKRVIYENVGR